MTATPMPPSVSAAIKSTPRRITFPMADSDPESVARNTGAVIFGTLVAMTAPIIQAYHADLFSDALGIHEMLLTWDRTAPLRFHYSFDNCGTTMTPFEYRPPAGQPRAYVVEVIVYAAPDRHGHGTTYMKIQKPTTQ